MGNTLALWRRRCTGEIGRGVGNNMEAVVDNVHSEQSPGDGEDEGRGRRGAALRPELKFLEGNSREIKWAKYHVV